MQDNRGLYEACKSSEGVIPVFIFDQNILTKLKNKKDRRVSFIYDSIDLLEKDIKKKGGRLLILAGDPCEIIPKLSKSLKVESVFTNEDYEDYATKRDSTIQKKLKTDEIQFIGFKDHVIFSGGEVLKKDGTPYRVFTPYKNEWLKQVSEEDIKDYNPNLKKLLITKPQGIKIVKAISDIGFEYEEYKTKAGEKEAKKLLSNFLKRIKDYDKNRDNISLNNNSHLSPYLRFGCISIRDLVRSSNKLKSDGAKVWLSELIWRDFYSMILDQFPHVEKSAFLPKYKNLKWSGKTDHFKLWKEGKTGYPIVDAAMRCFAQTGEMHNRLRMIVASFLVKDLIIDWKKGEQYFAQNLMDFELASNNGGWQWCASTGCDAQPYFRIFNPISQSDRFDPEGEFIKQWIPELKGYSKKYIHFPMKANEETQESANCIIGRDYPEPIVDHAKQREVALKLYKIAK
ncbi:MAG: deoxyribodipyrimidine photo-lyase [Bacteriovoracaceae bacterium]|nr:deoxyribodipyrimidine photo-lyase [Bacteriovoracaceae bacterium]